ncbi:hypothetical protein ACFY3M_53095 [Streptomyces mirabilis]|uniref:hypothetical protein n=1 Tax=Streptomyces mirabilis TaxID=68239 RepID=UPI0036B5F7A9
MAVAGRHGDEVQVWDDIKAVATDVLHRHRATITHHHTVGRDHRPAYDLQHSEPFRAGAASRQEQPRPAPHPQPGCSARLTGRHAESERPDA